VSWVPRIRTWKVTASRAAGSADSPTTHRSRVQGSNLPLEGTSFALWPDELTRHEYARRDLNPHPPGPRPGPSTCLRHERMEPLDRLERSPPGYDAGTLPGELQRHELPIVDSNHEPSGPGPDAATKLS
jgi:hypothetical protein